MSKVIEIWTDGAKKGCGTGGWGVYVKFNGQTREFCGGETDTTNNRMEMMAVIEGLKRVNRAKRISVVVFSDSALIVNCMKAGWIYRWEENGWKTSKKEDVLNKDLWIKIKMLTDAFTHDKVELEFKKVKGHAGIEGNEIADKLANKGVDMVKKKKNELEGR